MSEPVIDHCCLMVLEALKDFPPAVAMRALSRAAVLLNAAQQAQETGQTIGAFVPDPDGMEDIPGLATALASLIDVTRTGDDCDFLTAAGVAGACLKAKLQESSTTTRPQ